jgi:hypothetical protein
VALSRDLYGDPAHSIPHEELVHILSCLRK